jgi:predicted esterase
MHSAGHVGTGTLMRLSKVSKRLRLSHAAVVVPAAAVVGVWAFMFVAPSLPATMLFPPTTSPPKAPPQPVEPRVPTDAERMAGVWAQAYRQKDWPRAIGIGHELNRLAPGNTTYAYNLACSYARNAEPDKAAKWLAQAAADGFSLIKLLERDSDLEDMRSHAGYQAALAAVKKNRAAELADLRARFEETPMHMVLPPDYKKDQPAPLIVVLHGKGSRAHWIADNWVNVAGEMGAILIAPQAVYPHPGSSGFTWQGRDTNDSLCDDAEYLVRWTFEFAVKKYNIDRDRMVLTGFSEGGFVSQSVGPRTPHMFTGVIPMGSTYIREYDAPPKATGDRPPRFFFMSGEHDRTANEMPAAAEDYKAAGYETGLRIYPNVGHSFPNNRDEELGKAIEFVLRR